MQKTRNWLIGGAAALALAGMAAVADAQSSQIHEMTVQLPGGGVEHIRYSGDVKPAIVVMPRLAVADPFAADFAADFWPDRAFAQMQAIELQMDHRLNAMLEQANAMQAMAQSGRYDIAFGKMPPGTKQFTQISTFTSNGVCTRTISVTSPATAGAQPQLVSNVSGNCGQTAAPQSAAPQADGIIQANHHAPVARPRITRT